VKTVIGSCESLAKLSVPDVNGKIRHFAQIHHAGIRSKNAPIIFYAAKTFLPLVFRKPSLNHALELAAEP